MIALSVEVQRADGGVHATEEGETRIGIDEAHSGLIAARDETLAPADAPEFVVVCPMTVYEPL